MSDLKPCQCIPSVKLVCDGSVANGLGFLCTRPTPAPVGEQAVGDGSKLSEYTRGFDNAVRNITVAIARQLKTENGAQVDLGLQISLDIARSYHGWMDGAQQSVAGDETKRISDRWFAYQRDCTLEPKGKLWEVLHHIIDSELALLRHGNAMLIDDLGVAQVEIKYAEQQLAAARAALDVEREAKLRLMGQIADMMGEAQHANTLIDKLVKALRAQKKSTRRISFNVAMQVEEALDQYDKLMGGQK